jgi:hypothetical protein
MAVNLNKLQTQKNNFNNTFSSAFLVKNNIVVNEPVQTHFSVEGVQSYAPEELKAMRDR